MLLPLVNQLSTTCGIFTKSEDSSLLKLLSPLSMLLLPQELTTVTLYFMAYQNVSWKSSNMFKTLLQGSSTYLKSSIMLLLSLSVCTGFPLNRGSTSKFSSSPIKRWMERLLNTYPISFHLTVPTEISAQQIRNSSAKPLTTWKPMVPVLSPVLLRYNGTPYHMTSVTPVLLILLNGNLKLGSFA